MPAVEDRRPDRIFDPMTPHERTALAWERTAIATLVAGVLLARYATQTHAVLALIGVLQVLAGSWLLIWTGMRYEQLHGPLRRGESPAHPTAARLVGLSTVVFTGAALIVAVAITVT